MRTNRQARAVLGVIAQALQAAYQVTVPLAARAIDKDSRALQQAMTSRLDGVNKYAQRVYAGIPDDDAPISALNHQKVGLVLAQTRGAIHDVEESAQDSGLTGALTNALDQALGQSFAKHVTPEAKRWAVRIGVGVAVVIGLVVVGKLIHSISLGRSSALGEAEAIAVAIADAQRRKRHARSVYSVT